MTDNLGLLFAAQDHPVLVCRGELRSAFSRSIGSG